MSGFDPHKLHVTFLAGTSAQALALPRRYTLTHSDLTGDLFLSIGAEYDRKQICGWYTRLMRDEVLAEWKAGEDGMLLHVYCHVSGGLVLGTAGWRSGIFHHHLPMVLQALRRGDRGLFDAHPELDESGMRVHFSSHQERYNNVEDWGVMQQVR